jgi:hypothetical protein
MIRLFAAQATVLRNGSPDENQIVQENVAANRKSEITTSEIEILRNESPDVAARKSIFDVVIPVETILIIVLLLFALLFIVLVCVVAQAPGTGLPAHAREEIVALIMNTPSEIQACVSRGPLNIYRSTQEEARAEISKCQRTVNIILACG